MKKKEKEEKEKETIEKTRPRRVRFFRALFHLIDSIITQENRNCIEQRNYDCDMIMMVIRGHHVLLSLSR
jgi:hypothetical protein